MDVVKTGALYSYLPLRAGVLQFLTMCTLFLALQQHPRYPLLIAANRDEFYRRQTAPLQRWGEIVGGRDLAQGGHWLAVDGRGRFAALTNYRDPSRRIAQPVSRGELVRQYLQSELSIADYVAEVDARAGQYEGFNLLLGDATQRVAHYSNISRQLTHCPPGLYGLSNALLDTPWPKVEQGKQRLAAVLAATAAAQDEPGRQLDTALLRLLHNRECAPRDQLPATGVPQAMERRLSALFIASLHYGTRSSAVLSWSQQGELNFTEQSYGRMGRKLGLRHERLRYRE